MAKYTAAAALVLAFAAASLAAEQTLSSPQQQQQMPPKSADTGVSWTEVIECYRKPQLAIGCLESRMSRAMVSMRDTAVGLAHSDPDAAAEDVAGVGDLVQQIGEFITYGISSYFRGGDDDGTAAAMTSGETPINEPKDLGEERGHHKKKKIQKEIKKFVLKVLFGIYLFKQKIKMIIMTIQSILMSKFLVVAMIYAISNTFKIWYDIKWSKPHHHHDKVVYYENAHHQHHYEPPEHTEYDDHHDHHGWGSSIWGRSIVATEPSVNEPANGASGTNDGISRYIRRVSRTAQPQVGAQTMAYGGQIPSQ